MVVCGWKYVCRGLVRIVGVCLSVSEGPFARVGVWIIGGQPGGRWELYVDGIDYVR